MDIDSEILNLKGYLIREDFYIALVFEGVFIYDVFSLEFICSFLECAHVLCIKRNKEKRISTLCVCT